ncbi:MAG: Ig-like domain-containing protein [Deltaproteobacteria bacterium]|nr:Ig-like domain-containing protein [Deltaproteobacteria bacterium]
MQRPLAILACLALAFGCGDDDVEPDGGFDAGTEEDGGPPPVDMYMLPDFGPPPTGCGLLGMADPVEPSEDPAPAPDGWGELLGPGGPSVTFTEDQRLARCASLDGGDRDRDHHNTVLMLDGHLWMPWAHEGGVGGLSVFAFDDPCNPTEVGTTVEEQMRETHAAGVTTIDGRRWMVTASLTGIMFWDVSDPSAPVMVTDMTLPEVVYPDSYARVVMSTFWQAPYVYVGSSSNGIFIVDASDPENPELVETYVPDPSFRVGGVHAIGTLLAAFPTEGASTALLDVSDPAAPRRIPGGSFKITDGELTPRGEPVLRASYFSHLSGNLAFYARHVIGGGLITYDISDFSRPTLVSSYLSEHRFANGGYVFIKDDQAFVGLSGIGEVIDISEPSSPELLGQVEMTGDLDTMVPVGNVIVASVDDDAIAGEASNVYPWELEPDTDGPAVNMVVPRDGQERVALGARVGVTFDEPVDFASVFEGSFQLFELDERGDPVGGPLPGLHSGQEGAVNFAPAGPLKPGTSYRLVVPAGGVIDASGNPTAETFEATFTTASCE